MSQEIDHWSSPDGCHPDCPACAAATHECPSCDWSGPEAALKEIKDLHQRVDPGEPMPAGQCPECGALCHELAPGVVVDERPFDPDKNVDGSGLNNGQRATRAANAIAAYLGDELPDESNLSDLLCDLMHYAHRERRNFDYELRRGRGNFEAET